MGLIGIISIDSFWKWKKQTPVRVPSSDRSIVEFSFVYVPEAETGYRFSILHFFNRDCSVLGLSPRAVAAPFSP